MRFIVSPETTITIVDMSLHDPSKCLQKILEPFAGPEQFDVPEGLWTWIAASNARQRKQAAAVAIAMETSAAVANKIPTTPAEDCIFESKMAEVVQAHKQRLRDIGYTDENDVVIRPEMVSLPEGKPGAGF